MNDLPPPDPALGPPRILAIANQKGGVGKTTTAINLGTALAASGRRTLIIDLDPQGNASTGLGLAREGRGPGSYGFVLGSASLAEAVRETVAPGLEIVPATADLAAAEVELVEAERREHRLAEALAAAAGSPALAVEHILIDCPPGLGLLNLNALTAATGVLVPMQCEFLALEGLSQIMRTIERVQRHLNPRLSIEGVLLTMFDQRTNLAEQVAADVRSYLGAKVYETVIPRNIRVSEAPSHGLPVLLYDFRCPGAQAYLQLAKELLRRRDAEAAAAAA